MESGRTFKSLEAPANYFGCHIHLALVAIIMPVTSLLGLMFLHPITAILTVLSVSACSGALFGIGAWLGRADPFWVEGGIRHFMDETDYLDV